MAIPSLLGSYIDETYQRVVQYQGGEFADGTGSLINIGSGGVSKIIPGNNITISPSNGLGDVTINSYAGTYNTSTGSYGSFYDTGSYIATSDTAIYSMSLSTTDISNGVYISGSTNPYNTYVKFTNPGIYNLQFSAQFSNSDNTGADIAIWLRKNDNSSVNDLPDTTGICTVPPFKAGQNGQTITSWNYFVNVAADDYIQLLWHAEVANKITLETIAAGTNPIHPRIPALILTTNRIDTFLSNTIISTSGFTGSLQGTSSWATNAVTSYTPISTTGSTIYSTSPATSNVNPANGIFLGGGAGSAALKADYGVFLGYRAGYTATTASEAVFIGPVAGENASKADHSVFIGTGAGRNAVSASYSTIIGAYAGWAPSPSIGVGTNNIIIGNYVTLPDNARNSINIGGIIFATGSYSSFGTVYSGSMMAKVGVNNSNPQYNFDVSGSGNYSSGLTVTGSLNAPNITGSLRGTASWANNAVVANSATNATNATNVGVTNTTTGTGPYYLTFTAGTVGNNPLLVDSDGITYNATTNTLATTASWSTRPIAVTGSTIYSTSPSSITSFNSNNTNSNIFLGNNAGINSITASSCVTIGSNAGSGLKRVYNSVFIGSSAGVGAEYADNSVMIGLGAGQTATNASESVFLGDFAGYYAINAAYSTLIGYKSGFIPGAGGSKSIGSNNIIIGTNISLPLDRKDSINIGGIIFGTGSYSTITNIETDAYTGSTDGRIGIGVVNPTTKLQVNGTISATSKTNIGTFDVSGVHLSYDASKFGYLQAVLNDGGAGQYRPLFIDASLIGLNGNFIQMPNLIAATQTNIIGIDGNGYLYTQPATTIIAATPDEITFGSGSNVVEPENLEQSKYTTVNIFNFLNFS